MSSEISQYLKKLTDKTKFTDEEIMFNLKDCLKDKKGCVFSCGANINEHSDKFEQIKNDKSFVTCCIKSAIEVLNFETDILVLFGFINGNYLNNDKSDNSFILKGDDHFDYYVKDFYNLNKFTIDKYPFYEISFNIIHFLYYTGIKEIYLFGFYLADYMINDLTNYNYYDDIICNSFHNYDKPGTRIKENGILILQINSTILASYCDDNNILLYNVSEYGCLSNQIKRIGFECIFKNEKKIISSKIKYIDFLDEFNNKVDIDFYYDNNIINSEILISKTNNNNSNKFILNPKQFIVLKHIITTGIYSLKKVNKNDLKNEIKLNNFITDIMSMFSFILFYPIPLINKLLQAFFCHYLITFNKTFNVCFYNDFNKICCPEFYDNLLLLNIDGINNNKSYIDVFCDFFNEPKFKQNKYFELFIYLFYIKNLPKDFNSEYYKELNEDLKNFHDVKAISHYIYEGHKENRKYKYENIPEDFKPEEYKELNDDLKHMTDKQAKSHYEYDGFKENRKYKYENIPDDFKPEEYKELNDDLKHITDKQSKSHYEYYGFKENRKYKYENIPEDFKPEEYKELNDDLNNLTD